MTIPQRMIFNAFVQPVPSHHYEGLWRSPWGQADRYDDLQTWIRLAQRCEAAKFDGLFIADTLGLVAPYGGDHRAHAEGGMSFPNDDPIILCAALAAVTEHLSLGFTSSVIQNQPFEFARLASTIDRVTRGRAGWNVVTSAFDNSYRNVGFEQLPTHEERYARAHEFMKVVFSLWEGSWAPDAVVRDVERGVYADPSKIFHINHQGASYSVQGPHLCEPSPQRTPFLYTAGMSPSALRMAAEHAEALLIQVRTVEHARRLVDQLNELLPQYGRRPGDVKVLQVLHMVVGSTEEEAKRKEAEVREWINPRGSVVLAAGILGADLGGLDLDEEIVIADAPGFRGIFGAANLPAGQKTTTPREIAARIDTPPTVGTPEQIADEIERWRDAGVAGINVGDFMFHRSFTDVVEHVMPVLQKRGLAQSEYAPGTYRDKVFGEGPLLAERHPAARYRGAFSDSIG